MAKPTYNLYIDATYNSLGVTLSHNFSMTKHIDTVMASCTRTVRFRTLGAHGTSRACLQLVFRTTALAKLLNAAPAWCMGLWLL